MIVDPFYDVAMTQLAKDVLPPDERTPENIALLGSMLVRHGQKHEYFLSLMRGADIQMGIIEWTTSSILKGEIYFNGITEGVYECVNDTITEPGTSSDWDKVLDSFIGFNESVYFGDGLIALTYALNRRFATTFKDDPLVFTSDIYVETIPVVDDMFQIGYDESSSSAIFSDTCTESITAEDTVSITNTFTIYVPLWRFPTVGINEEKMIRNFVDNYIPSGLEYTIETY